MSAAPDRAKPIATAAALVTLVLAAVSWVVAVQRMNAMDMGSTTGLGSLTFFAVLWASMMAAMMLPGAVPAVWRHARISGRLRGVPGFVASYLALWMLVGLAIYAVYRPPGASVAGALAIAAGVYELTPVKQHIRRRCRATVRSGFAFGIECIGSSVGLMVLLVVLGVMSVGWMSVIAAVVLTQKLLPPHAALDIPVALAIVVLGVLLVLEPSAVPGFTPPM